MSLSLTKKDVRAKLQEPVGKRVKFNFPDDRDNKRGHLRERVIVRSGWHADGNKVGAVYWDVVDLIEFPHKGNPRQWVRIGYYRQVVDKLRWASQTTITEPLHQMKRIFAQAAKQKKWFRDLLPPA